MSIKKEVFLNPTAAPENAHAHASIAALKTHFPGCFDKHGALLPDKLAEALQSAGIPASREFYSLNWLGKSYARVLSQVPPHTLLAEDSAYNAKAENAASQNLLIQGDNLEVLKHLKNAYRGAVKMIYIDPPYNTGSDGFVYHDDRKFTPEQLAELGGMELDEARRVLAFTAKKSNSHSAWLTFMYPRLYVARELLREDGVIFISIDDNEQAQLKLLCDEVFGEENFLSLICWEKRFTRSNNSKTFASLVESVICYRKTGALDVIREPRNEKANSTFDNPDNDPRGVWTSVSYVNPATKEQRPNLHYSLRNPNTNEDVIHPTHAWKYEFLAYKKHVEEERLYWGRSGENKYPRLKLFLSELGDGMVPVNLWGRESTGTTDEASKLLQEVMGAKVFDFPKPIGLIARALNMSVKSGDLVLDFFAGSGTTAHAVMQLNAKDGGQRRYICVQWAEATDAKSEARKAGYQTIFDITQARIEKAAAKIRAEHPQYQGDLGVKIFKTVPDFRALDEAAFDPGKADLPLFTDATLDDDKRHTLLTTWRAHDGQALTDAVAPLDLAGYPAHWCGTHLYLLHGGFNSQALKALMERLDGDATFTPERIVFYGAAMESAMQKELAQAVDTYANKKSLNIAVLARY